MDKEEVRSEFAIFSDDGDSINRGNAFEALCCLGKNPLHSDVNEFFNDHGAEDSDATITFDSFFELYESIEVPTVDSLENDLKKFDTDDDGLISVEELKNILKIIPPTADIGIDMDISEEYVEEIFNKILEKADENNDNKLSCRELAQYLIPYNVRPEGAPEDTE